MVRRTVRVWVGVVVLALLGALMAGPVTARTQSAVGAAERGVTKDKIEMAVVIPDFDALSAKGINSGYTNETFARRLTAFVDGFGKINGREVDVKIIGWDPLDATSFDEICTEVTQDSEPFVVVNGTGYLTSGISCITVDNKTPFVSGDMASEQLLKASGKNLITLLPPPEIAAATAADVVARAKLIPKDAKIGILSNNEPALKASGDSLEKALEKRGYDVVSKIEVNGLASDSGLSSRECQAAATTFQAAGVDTVFNNQSFTACGSFFQEVKRGNLGFKIFALDGGTAVCSLGGSAKGLPELPGGITCITPWSGRTLPDRSGLAADTEFEAQCREVWDSARGKASVPGAPNVDLVVGDVTYAADFPSQECTLMNVLLPAMKKAGKDLTWEKVYDNVMKTTKAPIAYASNGEGGYGKNKPYLPTKVQLSELSVALGDTQKDANGLFNGCAVPQSCWVPLVINGQDWYPIKAS
jgi:hypothetical protein